MIQHDSGWSFSKPYGHYSCYEEGEKTVTFTPDTTLEEIAAYVREEAKLYRQGFGVRKTDDPRVITFWIACDSSD